MKPSSYSAIAITAGTTSLLVGSFIYLCFRSTDLVMFRFFFGDKLPSWVQTARQAMESYALPEWARFSLPDGLWLLAYLLIIDGIWHGSRNLASLLFLSVLPAAILISELLQLLHWLPGSGDWMDVVFYLLAISIFLTLKHALL